MWHQCKKINKNNVASDQMYMVKKHDLSAFVLVLDEPV